MFLFRNSGHKHLDGHKELSKHSPIITLEAKEGDKVYFPTLTVRNTAFEPKVKPGDQVKKGQLIAVRSDMYVPIYSPVSGVVGEEETVFSTNAGRPIKHLVIVSDGKNTLADPLKTVILSSSKEEIIAAIKEAGLVGLGGAGFPTYIKYNNPKGIDTLLVNGVECEPFITTDYVTCQKEAATLEKGCEFLMKASGASKCVIAVKVHKEEQRDAILKAIEGHNEFSLVEVPDAYPMGWERALIKQALNRTYKALPGECGVVISNVQTIIALGNTLLTGRPLAERTITISGDAIKNPSNVICPIGTPVSKLIAACGGLTNDGATLIPGGPMCGKAVSSDAFPVLMTTGAITIINYKKQASETCLRCGKCTDNCPMGLQPVEIVRAHKAKDFDRLAKLQALSCVECGMCSYVCPSKIEVTDTIKSAKTVLRFRQAAAQKK